MSQPLLSGEQLSFRYGDHVALEDVSFSCDEGQLIGFLGPNGAGKSTLFQLLSGLLTPAAAQKSGLRWQGSPISPKDRNYRASIGVVFQTPSLDLKLSGRENLALGASLYGIAKKEALSRMAEALELFELTDRADDLVESYSGGMRRRLELGRVLLHKPRLLVMDEPTQGLDIASSRKLWEYLGALRKSQKLAILLTTHDPAEGEQCDQLTLLDRGRVIARGTPAELCAKVGGDVVRIQAERPSEIAVAIAAAWSSKLGLAETPQKPIALDIDDAIQVEAPRGHELIPRIIELFPAGRIRAISTRAPSLGDAFVKLTGRSLQQDTNTIAGSANG